jgi:hypothetical protein
MKTAARKWPVHNGEPTATRLACETFDASTEGWIVNSNFAGLMPEQLDFVETFVRGE